MSEDQNDAPAAKSPQQRARGLLRIVAIVLAAYFLLQGILGLLVPPVEPHPVQELNLKVIAHRGGKAEYPENTLEAFRSAVESGVDAIEMDVRLSADGIPVVIHDEDVYRTTSGEGAVSEYSFQELQVFDAGWWWPFERKPDCEVCAERGDDEFPFRRQGLVIPSLEQVFAEFPEVPKIIEIKPESPEAVRAVGDLLRRYNQENLSIIASFHDSNLKLLRDLYPEIATAASQREVTVFYVMNLLGFGSAYPSAAEFFQVPIDMGRLPVITEGFLRGAEANNVLVHAWTIDDRQEMTWLLDLGIDGIMTSEPSVLLDVLGR